MGVLAFDGFMACYDRPVIIGGSQSLLSRRNRMKFEVAIKLESSTGAEPPVARFEFEREYQLDGAGEGPGQSSP